MSEDSPSEKAAPRTFHFDTNALHAGARPDAVTGARAVPIYQSSSFVFDDDKRAAGLFALQDYGYIYSRIGNPTTSAFEERIATLEGGVGAQFDITLRKLGIDAVFVDPSRPENFRAAGRGGYLPQAGGDFRRGG